MTTKTVNKSFIRTCAVSCMYSEVKGEKILRRKKRTVPTTLVFLHCFILRNPVTNHDIFISYIIMLNDVC